MKLPLILGVTGQTGRYLLCELIESLTIMSVCEAGRCVTPVVDLPAQVGPSCASYLHGFGSTGLRFQLSPTAWKNRATQLSSTSYTIFSAHSSSDASKSTLNVHFPPRRSMCSTRR